MMSIASDRSDRRRIVKEPEFNGCVAAVSIFDSPEFRLNDELSEIGEANDCCASSLSSASSSIGKNSDLSGRSSEDNDDCGETEVQSSYTLDSMNALEEALPIRRGISKFYSGKSKSYTSLGDAFCSSTVKDMVKPENAYSKKRRNLLAFNMIWEKSRNPMLRSNGGGISKRSIRPSRSTLAFAVAMGSSESISDISTDSNSSSYSRSPPPRPPLHPQTAATNDNTLSFSPRQHLNPWRSFSSVDLQGCVYSSRLNNVSSFS